MVLVDLILDVKKRFLCKGNVQPVSDRPPECVCASTTATSTVCVYVDQYSQRPKICLFCR